MGSDLSEAWKQSARETSPVGEYAMADGAGGFSSGPGELPDIARPVRALRDFFESHAKGEGDGLTEQLGSEPSEQPRDSRGRFRSPGADEVPLGSIFEDAVGDVVRELNDDVVEQLQVRTKSGTRVKVDFAGRNNDMQPLRAGVELPSFDHQAIKHGDLCAHL